MYEELLVRLKKHCVEYCDHVNQPDANFCAKCGKPIHKTFREGTFMDAAGFNGQANAWMVTTKKELAKGVYLVDAEGMMMINYMQKRELIMFKHNRFGWYATSMTNI